LEAAGEGRLGNVAAVVVPGDPAAAPPQRLADALARLFERVETVAAPAASPLARVVAALDAVATPRVLVVDASFEAPADELVLALTAWPERPAVVSRAGSPPLAIYVREQVLPRARARLAAGDTGVEGWLSECGAEVIDPATLAALAADG